MRHRLLVRLTALVLLAGVAYQLAAAAAEYRRLAAELTDSRRREAGLDRAAEELQYQHAAEGVLHARPAGTPATGGTFVAVQFRPAVSTIDS